MDLFFLQADTTGVAKAAPKVQNLWEVLVSGGVIMIPLGILFIAAVYFFFERLIAINKAAKIDDSLKSKKFLVIIMSTAESSAE